MTPAVKIYKSGKAHGFEEQNVPGMMLAIFSYCLKRFREKV